MKMVKSLLLGSAAGLVAVAGAQAADLPVKAKPVEYVKICSIYGAGFFYIPGTDTCIKIGGWVRAEVDFNAGASHTAYYAGGGGRNNRIDTADTQWRSRFVTSVDIRTQTEYGTLRAYTRAGFQWTTNTDGIGTYYVERTFIQFAGFTFGRSQSYFDFYANAMYYTGYIGGPSSTGAAGMNVLAYTATFGNGFTATLSLEDATLRRSAIWDAGADALAIGASPGPSCQAATGYRPRDWLDRSARHQRPRPEQPTYRPARSVSVTTRLTRCPTSSARSVLTRLGVRRRSPAPCTRFARASTATTSRLRMLPATRSVRTR